MKHLLFLLFGILAVGGTILIIWILATFKIVAIGVLIIASLLACYLIGMAITEKL